MGNSCLAPKSSPGALHAERSGLHSRVPSWVFAQAVYRSLDVDDRKTRASIAREAAKAMETVIRVAEDEEFEHSLSKDSDKNRGNDLPLRIRRVWYINPYGHEVRLIPNPKVLAGICSAGAVVYSVKSLYMSLMLRGGGAALAGDQQLPYLPGAPQPPSSGFYSNAAVDSVPSIPRALAPKARATIPRTPGRTATITTELPPPQRKGEVGGSRRGGQRERCVGSVSDLIPIQESRLAMPLYTVRLVLGPSVAPVFGGFLTDRCRI
ncbi:hypothetical protein DL764_000859 [Monosporascus ibericus]|uniref:Uncharacterized protein n=1 Tax=Monosporascus ibericus TaxID=155417 RepID=A0A4V1XCL3_9PEZI|nr:hypothetical protein DL764_000859 [Monosporascus ibericus]